MSFHGSLIATGSKDGVVTIFDVSSLLPPELCSKMAVIWPCSLANLIS
jgi:hypothetical protein